MRTSLSHSFAILQTCKQVNEEGTQLLYAVGSFHFPSDVLRQVDLSSLGHKLSLLRNVKLHFDMWWDKYPNTSRDLEGLLDDTCMDNISLLAAGERVRRYVCTLVFENCEMRGPSEVKWWDALEELDVFERVVVELEFQDPKTYPRSKEVSGRLERWEEIKQDVRMYIELYWDDVLDWQRRCGRV